MTTSIQITRGRRHNVLRSYHLSNLFAMLFEWKTTKTQHQSETEIIKDKKDYKKATNIAEKIIDIAQQYKADMTFAHRLKFVRLVQAFKKYN